LKTALGGWNRGYCPCCGSWPAFIEAGCLLRCSYCAASWALNSRRCLYCGNNDDRFIVAAPDMARADRCLELCGRCRGYIKALEVASPFPLIAIDDLASMDLDEGAMRLGYHRPDLFDL